MPGFVHVVDDDASFRTAMPGSVEKPGCILLDVQMPGLGGLELQNHLVELGSILPIVFVTGYSDIPTTVRAIKAGAEDFLTKPIPSEQMIAAIERALVRCDLARSQRTELDSFLGLIATLTPRERQVYDLIVRGQINKQIANELGTTERTVKAHRHEVMEKLQAQSLAELVSRTVRLGGLVPDANSGN